VGRVAGLIYGADLVGACLGAFLSSALLIPVLGIPQTCYAVALLSLAGVALLIRWLYGCISLGCRFVNRSSPFLDELHDFRSRDAQVKTFHIQWRAGFLLRPDHKRLTIFALYLDFALFSRLFQ
jgi:hypothetical protein